MQTQNETEVLFQCGELAYEDASLDDDGMPIVFQAPNGIGEHSLTIILD